MNHIWWEWDERRVIIYFVFKPDIFNLQQLLTQLPACTHISSKEEILQKDQIIRNEKGKGRYWITWATELDKRGPRRSLYITGFIRLLQKPFFSRGRETLTLFETRDVELDGTHKDPNLSIQLDLYLCECYFFLSSKRLNEIEKEMCKRLRMDLVNLFSSSHFTNQINRISKERKGPSWVLL
jgi:hypothetical protein